MRKIQAKKHPKPTAEEEFESAWDEFGFSGSDITREFRFHPSRKWRFDFAFPSRKVAIEIDGRGRHQTLTGVRADCEKHNTALYNGWAVFHLPTSDIRAKDKSGTPYIETFIELICDFLTQRENYGPYTMDSEMEQVQSLLSSPKRKASRPVSRKASC